jgi:hypothetical protein
MRVMTILVIIYHRLTNNPGVPTITPMAVAATMVATMAETSTVMTMMITTVIMVPPTMRTEMPTTGNRGMILHLGLFPLIFRGIAIIVPSLSILQDHNI